MTLNELIQSIINNAAMNVCLATESYLDKITDMTNHHVSSDYKQELISECFEIFTESTARRKKADKIDEWILKNGFGNVHSNNSAQAKKARSLRNFFIIKRF